MERIKLFTKIKLRWKVSRKWDKVARMQKEIDKLLASGQTEKANELARKATKLTEEIESLIKDSDGNFHK